MPDILREHIGEGQYSSLGDIVPATVSVVTLSRTAFRHNVGVLQNLIQDKTLCAVVKSNAYGHGVDLIVPELVSLGVNTFAVSQVHEGIWIRRRYPSARILVLCDPLWRCYRDIIALRLEPVLNDFADVECYRSHMSEFSKAGVKIHFKVDTGMGRLGLHVNYFQSEFPRIAFPTGMSVGLMTHFAMGEDPLDALTQAQCQVFRQVIAVAKQHCSAIEVHCANSSATLHKLMDQDSDMVRVGIALYGGIEDPRLKAVMSWKSKINYVRHIVAGKPIGYGHTWIVQRDTRVAIVPVGYRLGYQIAHSNVGHAQVAGQLVPVIGRVSMDMTCLDVTDVKLSDQSLLGQEAVLMSRDDIRKNDVFALAKQANTIPYEILCGIHPGIRREWWH